MKEYLEKYRQDIEIFIGIPLAFFIGLLALFGAWKIIVEWVIFLKIPGL